LSWLKLVLLLAQLTFGITQILRDRGLIADAEVKGALKGMEQVNAKLQKAIDARAAPAAGSVRDDRYKRD
jgi:hypothetical protein